MIIKRSIVAIAGLAALTLNLFGTTVSYKLFINSGIYTAVDGSQFPACAFNPTNNFALENARIIASTDDTIVLKLINNDSVLHGFKIDGKVEVLGIAPLDSTTVSFSYESTLQSDVYYDPTEYPRYRALGLAGLIFISAGNTPTFYWDLKAFQKSLAFDLSAGTPVDWTAFYPDYFTVNGRSYPDINSDANARVTGTVGNSIYIIIANTGQSIHSMHFHGYHAEIVFSSEDAKHVGRLKDTFPIKSMQTLVLELTPDKPGEFPVHEHNLVAITAGSIYPNGILLTMLIQ